MQQCCNVIGLDSPILFAKAIEFFLYITYAFLHVHTTIPKAKRYNRTNFLKSIFKTFEPCMKYIVSKLIYILCFVTHEEESVLYDIYVLTI